MLIRASSTIIFTSTLCALIACGPNGSQNARRADSATGSVAARSSLTDTGTRVAVDSASGTVLAPQAQPGQFTPLPPNHLGRIPVLEYHQITDHDADYVRSRETFKKELDLVYSRGYRPITMSQMLDKNFSDVPAGMSPVVYTFDDASPSQFRYIVGPDSQLQIDPESGIGIWLAFAKAHPDWKGKAVFCLLSGGDSGHNFFGDGANKGTLPATFEGQRRAWRFLKVKWLADNGFELCDHTVWHMQLSKYPADKVQWQIAANIMAIDSAVPGYTPRTMALPQGLWPKPPSLAWQGSWTDPKSGKTIPYHFGAVLEVAGGPARSPFDPKFNGDSIPRVQMSGTQLVNALNQLDKVTQADKTRSRFVQ